MALIQDYLSVAKIPDEGTRELFEQLTENKNTVQLLSELADYDKDTYYHSLRVYELAVFILKWSWEGEGTRRELLGEAALLHDVGKLQIPKDIIRKPCVLNEMEQRMMRQHPELGAELLQGLGYHPLVTRCILEHHEKLDGSGYPAGKKEDEILYISKILTVADVFDAITVKRCYNNAIAMGDAIHVLRNTFGLDTDAIWHLSYLV